MKIKVGTNGDVQVDCGIEYEDGEGMPQRAVLGAVYFAHDREASEWWAHGFLEWIKGVPYGAFERSGPITVEIVPTEGP